MAISGYIIIPGIIFPPGSRL